MDIRACLGGKIKRKDLALSVSVVLFAFLMTACGRLASPSATEEASSQPAGGIPVTTDEAAPPKGASTKVQPGLPQNPQFTHITVEQGLSDQRVHTILQDSAGFMWFGTINGLNRYDGYNIVEYRNDPTDPHSLSNNWVDDLYEDRSGILWVATRFGLNAFDRRTERFTRYLHDPENPHSLSSNTVFTIHEDQAGVLWFGTLGGLNRFDRAAGIFTAYRHDPDDPESLSNDVVLPIHEDRSGAMWIGTYGGGLNHFDRATGTFTTYRHIPDDPGSLSHDVIWDVHEDRSGTLWVATEGGGLNRFDRATATFTAYRHDPDDPHSLGHEQLDNIFEDATGALWVATFGGGLSVLDPERETFTTFRSDSTNPASISNDTIADITADRSGLIWLATQGGGVDVYSPQQQAFTIYRHDLQVDNGLPSNKVWVLHEDHDDVLWIGTMDRGLVRFDRQSGQVRNYPPEPKNPESLGHPYVSAIEQDPSGAMWIGTYGGGLYRLDPASGIFSAFRRDPANPQSLSHDVIGDLHIDETGALWVGTAGGLDRFEPASSSFSTYPLDPDNPQSSSQDIVWVITEDLRGHLWIGTFGGGLNRLEPDSGQVTRYRHDPENPTSLSDNTIYSLHIDRLGVLWVGTAGGGLNRFDANRGSFAHYREGDGLASDRIVSILEDGDADDPAAGNLWITTGRGLSKLDRGRTTFRTYSVSDGLPVTEFNRGGLATRSSGELLMGSIDGMIAFNPDTIRDDIYVPPVVFTDFLLANKPVQIGAGTPLQQSIDQTDTIELTYADKVISLEFAALSYYAPSRNRYRYRLEGFDEDWIEVSSTQRLVTYTNLDPGRYVFRVTGSNGHGLWNEIGREVTLVITPPWWQTTAFRIGIAVLVIGLAIGLYRWRVHNIETRNRELEVQVAERTHKLAATNEDLTVETVERIKIETQLNRRIEWLSSLNQIRQTIDGVADLPLANEKLFDSILQLLGAKAVFLIPWDGLGERLGVQSRQLHEGSVPVLDKLASSFEKGTPLRNKIELGESIDLSADQVASLPEPMEGYLRKLDSQSLLLEPMIIRQSVAGVIGVAIPRSLQNFTQSDANLVETMARDLSVVAEQAYLIEQTRTLAVTDERNRLARDLHDSVTQVLFSATLVAEVLPRVWRRDPERAMRSLEKLRWLTHGALAEMRTMLLELRPAAVINTHLGELLAQLTEAVTSRSGLPFQLFIEQTPPLPETVHMNFYRVAQEALNNVVKHAQANLVTVSLSTTAFTPDADGASRHEVTLLIEDDGIGYSSAEGQPEHMGRGIMHERAAAIDAALSLESQPGYGTKMTLIWSNESGNHHE